MNSNSGTVSAIKQLPYSIPLGLNVLCTVGEKRLIGGGRWQGFVCLSLSVRENPSFLIRAPKCCRIPAGLAGLLPSRQTEN